MTDSAPEVKTLSAKQVATRIGTDAKTIRKFFRSEASPYPAVGQGGRYDFPEEDVPRIKEFFEAWAAGKTTRTPKEKVEGETPTRSRRKGRTRPVVTPIVEVDEEDEELDLEPTDDDMFEEVDNDEGFVEGDATGDRTGDEDIFEELDDEDEVEDL